MFSICYIDEAGCTGVLPSATSSIQPAFIITSLIVDEGNLNALTTRFVGLKLKYFPTSFANLKHDLDALTVEIKGCDIRRDLRGDNKTKRKQRQKFLDEIFSLLDDLDVRLVARIWIKGIGAKFDGRAIYTNTTQRLAWFFEQYLNLHNLNGMIIADFREPQVNSHVSHSVFTQKSRHLAKGGDVYPHLLELPTFGVSNNHAGL